MLVGENVKSFRTERLFVKMALEIRYDRYVQKLFKSFLIILFLVSK